MNSTLEETLQERVPGPIKRGLGWLDSKLSRVTSSREFIPEIDGLRFIAIFFVIVFHAAVHILQLRHRPPIIQKWVPGQSVVLSVIGNLFLGVQIFFVISGLVVALPFARSAIRGTPKPSLRKYFMRRLTRIEPPYILALLVMYYLLKQYRFYLPHLLAGLLYLHRLIYGVPNPINQVTWTLEIEVIFYILAPWITSIYRIPGRSVRWFCQLLLIITASCFVHYWLLPFGPPLSYYFFTAALPWFLSGILLADFYVSGLLSRSNHPAWDAPALLGLAAFLYFHVYGPAWQFAWLGPIMVMMLVAGGIKGVLVSRFLRFRPITLIGGMCYSIYLWHIPIMDKPMGGFAAMVPHGLSDLQLATLYCIVAVPLILVFSMPLYYFTERPFMNGPGSRFIERILRGAYRVQSKLIRFPGSNKANTDLSVESVSRE